MITSWQDLVNGSFEMAGGFFILLSIIKLYEDKKVHGVSWLHSGFFAVWGFWNLYFYPHLDQWWSFWGGVGIVSTNTIWLAMMIYYIRRNKGLRDRWRAERDGDRYPAEEL